MCDNENRKVWTETSAGMGTHREALRAARLPRVEELQEPIPFARLCDNARVSGNQKCNGSASKVRQMALNGVPDVFEVRNGGGAYKYCDSPGYRAQLVLSLWVPKRWKRMVEGVG